MRTIASGQFKPEAMSRANVRRCLLLPHQLTNCLPRRFAVAEIRPLGLQPILIRDRRFAALGRRKTRKSRDDNSLRVYPENFIKKQLENWPVRTSRGQ